jgi:hypothetical protein
MLPQFVESYPLERVPSITVHKQYSDEIFQTNITIFITLRMLIDHWMYFISRVLLSWRTCGTWPFHMDTYIETIPKKQKKNKKTMIYVYIYK